MKIATILPTRYVWLEEDEPYHLCLAHQVKKDLTYASFFRKKVRDGAFVICDNGAAEFGVPISIDELLPIVKMLGCTELVLPDTIGDMEATLLQSWRAFNKAHKEDPNLGLIAVPHGRDRNEWSACAEEMLRWGVDTIGISKFLVPKVFPSRADAIREIVRLMFETDRKVDVHLLGYTGIENEIRDIGWLFPSTVRGIDSSIPTLYAQIGQEMKDERPDVALDLDAEVDEDLLKRNIKRWREICSTSS